MPRGGGNREGLFVDSFLNPHRRSDLRSPKFRRSIITIKFIFWRFETSLVYIILGSIGLGILFTLLFWIPRALRASFRAKKSNQGSSST